MQSWEGGNIFRVRSGDSHNPAEGSEYLGVIIVGTYTDDPVPGHLHTSPGPFRDRLGGLGNKADGADVYMFNRRWNVQFV